MMRKLFILKYRIHDRHGHESGLGQQEIIMDANDVGDDMTDSDLEQDAVDAVAHDLQVKLFAEADNVRNYIDWARQVQRERNQ